MSEVFIEVNKIECELQSYIKSVTHFYLNAIEPAVRFYSITTTNCFHNGLSSSYVDTKQLKLNFDSCTSGFVVLFSQASIDY